LSVQSFQINCFFYGCPFAYPFGVLHQSVVVIFCHSVVISWRLNDYQMTIE